MTGVTAIKATAAPPDSQCDFGSHKGAPLWQGSVTDLSVSGIVKLADLRLARTK
jgi:hypothetical protein